MDLDRLLRLELEPFSHWFWRLECLIQPRAVPPPFLTSGFSWRNDAASFILFYLSQPCVKPSIPFIERKKKKKTGALWLLSSIEKMAQSHASQYVSICTIRHGLFERHMSLLRVPGGKTRCCRNNGSGKTQPVHPISSS